MEKSPGKVVIFSAPSGAGKTTITRHVLNSYPQIAFSVSATTRPRRGTEEHGKDYYFLRPEEFQQRIQQGDFVEWEEVYPGGFYGTLKEEVERIWAAGKHVVFDVDVKGGVTLKKIFGDRAISFFVMPPSIDVLEKRLKSRGTDPEESIRNRVNKAFSEIEYYHHFDYIIINDKLEIAKAEVKGLIDDFLAK